MDEQDLQISITAVDEASGTLQNVAAEAEGLATSVNEAAASIEGALTSSLTAAEEAAVESALASARAWMGAEEDIAGTAAATAETLTEEFDTIATASRAAALATVPTWEASLSEIASLGAMTSAEVDTAFANMSASAKKGAADTQSTMTSMHGYFRMLIAGYLADTAGKSMIDAVLGTVTAAGGDPQKFAELQTQLASAQAELQKLALPISGKGKTTDELHADEAEQASRIAATKLKIQELTAQMEPLAFAQERAGQAARDFDAATKTLTEDWQKFLITSGAPLLDLLAHLTQILDTVINRMTQFAAAHPKLAEAILITVGVLGGLLLVLGSILIAVAPVIILFGMFGVAISGASLAAAAAGAAIVAAVTFAVAAITANWNTVARTTTAVWDGIVLSLSAHWETIKTGVQAAWTWIANFIEGVWGKIVSGAEGAIGSIQKLISGIMAPINGLTSAVSGIAGSIGNAAGGVLSSLPHFAEGGIVSSPTIGLIGEAGPEAIIPLSAFAGGMGLSGSGGGARGGNIVINLSGNFYGSDEQLVRKLSQSLGTMINRQMKLRSH